LVGIIEKEAKSRTQLAPITPGLFKTVQVPVEVTVGGATLFILEVDQFIKL